jgi:pimeloyl-ACP methyl ester carboxylesterase
LETAHETSQERPELVLLAGLLCDETIWSDVAAKLVDIAHVTIFEFKGFSSIEAMAEHVIALAPKRFILVGHSMGGRIALEVVRRAPQRIRALGLFNTGIHPTAEHEPKSRGELVQLAQDQGMRKLAERWLPPMMDSNNDAAPALLERLTAMIELASPDSFEKHIVSLLHRPDALSVLPSIHMPTLLLSATGDRWSPVAQHEEIRRHVPHADLVVIEHAGHMAPVEQPQAVAVALRTWIAALGDENLDDVQRLKIEALCTRQINRYARLNDTADFGVLAHLYTQEGVFARPTEPSVHVRGRDAILTSLRARPPRMTRHIMIGIEVSVDSSTRARAHSTILLFVGEGATLPAPIKATLIGAFNDVLVKHGNEWLFSQRLGSLHMKNG